MKETKKELLKKAYNLHDEIKNDYVRGIMIDYEHTNKSKLKSLLEKTWKLHDLIFKIEKVTQKEKDQIDSELLKSEVSLSDDNLRDSLREMDYALTFLHTILDNPGKRKNLYGLSTRFSVTEYIKNLPLRNK